MDDPRNLDRIAVALEKLANSFEKVYSTQTITNQTINYERKLSKRELRKLKKKFREAQK